MESLAMTTDEKFFRIHILVTKTIFSLFHKAGNFTTLAITSFSDVQKCLTNLHLSFIFVDSYCRDLPVNLHPHVNEHIIQ